MSTTYQIEVQITPLCAACGGELEVGMTESKVTGHPFKMDNPLERTHRRVFVYACEKCFVLRTAAVKSSD